MAADETQREPTMTDKQRKKRGPPAGSTNARKGAETMTERVAFRLPAELKSDLVLIAQARGTKLSPVVIKALRAGAAAEKKELGLE